MKSLVSVINGQPILVTDIKRVGETVDGFYPEGAEKYLSAVDLFSDIRYGLIHNLEGIDSFTSAKDGTVSWNGILAAGYNDSPLYVRVGTSGTIQTSISGDNGSWVSRSSGVNASLDYIFYDGSKYFAVGTSGTLVWSPDGETWNNLTIGSANLTSICMNSDSVFVATAQSSGTVYCSGDPTVLSNWKPVYGLGSYSYNASTSRGNMLVVAGDNGSIATSTDGANWTIRQNLADNTRNLTSIIDFNGTFIASGTHRTIYTSVNGIDDWTERGHSAGSGITLSLFTANGYVYAVGTDGACMVSKDSGITWSNGPSTLVSSFLRFGTEDYTNRERAIVVGDHGTVTIGNFAFSIDAYPTAHRIESVGSVSKKYSDPPSPVTIQSMGEDIMSFTVGTIDRDDIDQGLPFEIKNKRNDSIYITGINLNTKELRNYKMKAGTAEFTISTSAYIQDTENG